MCCLLVVCMVVRCLLCVVCCCLSFVVCCLMRNVRYVLCVV